MRAIYEFNKQYYITNNDGSFDGPIKEYEVNYCDDDYVCYNTDIGVGTTVGTIIKKDDFYEQSFLENYLVLYTNEFVHYNGSIENHISPDEIFSSKLYNILIKLNSSQRSEISNKLDDFIKFEFDDLFDEEINGFKCSEIYNQFLHIAEMIDQLINQESCSRSIFFCNELCMIESFKSLLSTKIIPLSPLEMSKKLMEYIKHSKD